MRGQEVPATDEQIVHGLDLPILRLALREHRVRENKQLLQILRTRAVRRHVEKDAEQALSLIAAQRFRRGQLILKELIVRGDISTIRLTGKKPIVGGLPD